MHAYSFGSAMFAGFLAYKVFRVKSKCLVVDSLSFFVVTAGFSTISALEGFSKYSRVYGNYKFFELK